MRKNTPRAGPKRARPQLRPREVQVVLFLENVVRELVARGHPDPDGRAVLVDDVHASDLGFLAAVFGMRWHKQGLAMRPQDRAVALVEPLRRGPYAAVARTSPLF